MSTKSETLFLETTVQVGKIFGCPNSKRDKINNIINKYDKVVTTTYVLKEFRLGFLKAAVDFYNLLENSDDVSEALRKAHANFWGRKPGKIINIFSLLIENYNGRNLSKIEILKRLDYLIDGALEHKFFKNIEQPLIDKTGCIFGLLEFVPVKDHENNIWEYKCFCNKNAPNDCNLENFIDINLFNIEKIYKSYETIDDIDNETKKRLESAKKVIYERDLPYGRNCINLSDWLICLEAKDTSKIFTTNIKHYKKPCNLLNIDVHRL